MSSSGARTAVGSDHALPNAAPAEERNNDPSTMARQYLRQPAPRYRPDRTFVTSPTAPA